MNSFLIVLTPPIDGTVPVIESIIEIPDTTETVIALDRDGTVFCAQSSVATSIAYATYQYLGTVFQSKGYDIRQLGPAPIQPSGGMIVLESIEKPSNSPPVLAPIGNKSVQEGETLNFIVEATDEDGNPLILKATPLSANMSFQDQGNGQGWFTFNPDFTQSGEYSITFTADDSQLTSTVDMAINVINVNRPPIIGPLGNQPLYVGAHLVLPVSATDPDSDPLTLNASPLADNSSFTDHGNGTGEFCFQPLSSQIGNFEISFYALDGEASTSETITVSVLNRKPVAEAEEDKSVFIGKTVDLNGGASYDPDNQTLAYSWTMVSKPEGSVSQLSNSDLMKTRFVADLTGEYIISLVVNDGIIDSEPSLVSVTVKSKQEASIEILQEMIFLLEGFDDKAFMLGNVYTAAFRKNNLINTLNSATNKANEEYYSRAMYRLMYGFIKRTDGCAKKGGAPDYNDWIIDCQAQNQIYSLAIDTLNLFRSERYNWRIWRVISSANRRVNYPEVSKPED